MIYIVKHFDYGRANGGGRGPALRQQCRPSKKAWLSCMAIYQLRVAVPQPLRVGGSERLKGGLMRGQARSYTGPHSRMDNRSLQRAHQ